MATTRKYGWDYWGWNGGDSYFAYIRLRHPSDMETINNRIDQMLEKYIPWALQAGRGGIWEGSGHQLKIEAPFVNVSKAEVVRIGLELGVPYELTWSCYEGGEKPCGKCGTCIDRAAAFQANHVEDPALR